MMIVILTPTNNYQRLKGRQDGRDYRNNDSSGTDQESQEKGDKFVGEAKFAVDKQKIYLQMALWWLKESLVLKVTVEMCWCKNNMNWKDLFANDFMMTQSFSSPEIHYSIVKSYACDLLMISAFMC